MLHARPSYLFLDVTDLDRSLAFYRDRLGLPLEFSDPGTCAFLRLGDFRIALYAGRDAPVCQPPMLALDVPDIETSARALRERGVDIGPVEAVPGGRAARFADPDGHRFELHQPDRPTS